MICVAVLGRGAIFLPFSHGLSRQVKINVKIKLLWSNRYGEQERFRAGKRNVVRANDFNLIKNHAILKKYGFIQASSFCRFC